ncbi:Hypothetical predicted protein [Mytilus galloprovincialis]|nr:Hypothetical predicted protein [Mytilus galloprovincialis]
MWTNACEAIQRIGSASSFKTECDMLMSSDLDSSYREVYVSFAQQERRLEKVEKEYNKVDEELQSAKEKICQLEESKDNTKDNLLLEVADWEQDNENFFVTSTVHKILECVKQTPFVVISGSPGMGKSATAYYIALFFRNIMGYEILPIKEPSEIVKFCKTGRKQIVIIDDICGKFAINNNNVESWKKYKKSISNIVSQSEKSIHIVATCRLHISKTKNFEKLVQAFEIKECDLLSDELALDLNEKRKIGLCHLDEQYLNLIGDKFIDQMDCFPLLCKLSSGTTFNPDFFKKPYDIFKIELDEMLSDSKECFFGLALLVLFNNNLNTSLFKDKNNKIFNAMFEELFEELEMSNMPSKSSVLSSLQTLKGSFVKESECSFSAIHDKVFDFIAFFIGEKLVKSILNYGNSTFIAERMSFTILDKTDNFVIMLNEDQEELYFQRIEEEIRSRTFATVFRNVMATTTYYQEKLISLLSKQCDTFSILTGNLWALVLSAANECDILNAFITEERLKRVNSELTTQAQSEADVVMWGALCDTQINTDDDEIQNDFLISINGPLCTAVSYGLDDVVQVLLNTGNAININKTLLIKDMEMTPLLYACSEDKANIVKMFIQFKADVNLSHTSNEGCTPLHAVCFEDDDDILELLLNCEECDLNKRNDLKETPLFIACQNGSECCVALLVERQCEINCSNIEGQSPLQIACMQENYDIIDILLKNKYCEIDHVDSKNDTALTSTCERGNTEIARLLTLHGCKINTANNHGMTALHISAAMGFVEIVELLLLNDCDINICDSNNQTPLSLAIENCQKPCIELLISHDCDVNIFDFKEQTPLNLACRKRYVDIVELLLNIDGCDIDKSNNNRETPLAVACAQGCKDIVEHLILRNCDINTVNVYGLSPLHIAVGSDNIGIAQLLIGGGCNLNSCDANKRTPLFCACETGNYEAVELLLNKGCDANICNENGLTPLDIATFNNFFNIVSYIYEKQESNKSEAIQRIVGASFKIECDILMSSDLDSSYREVYVTFAQQERRLKKVEE